MNLFLAYKTIYKLPVRSSAILVYYDLTRRTNNDNECWPSKQTIAKACHISVSTVTRSLRELEKTGMILTVYRYRDDNNRQTSNIYRIFDTPQNFSNPSESPNQTEDFPAQQLAMDENIPAACQQLEDTATVELYCPPAAVISVETDCSSNYTTPDVSLPCAAVQAKVSKAQHCSAFFPQVFALKVLLFFFRAKYDTPDRITVTPQGTIPEMKVTDNPRKKSIFSQLTKRYIERHRKKHAGFGYCPAQNE